MRRILTLLLCLALPWQAWAAQSSVVLLCPMGNMAMMASAEPGNPADSGSGDVGMESAESCCNDLAAFLQTGQHCKSGQDCTTGTVLFLGQVPAPQAHARAQPVQAAPPLSGPSDPSARIWRPPTRML